MNIIQHGDCIQELHRLEAGSVDLAFADPPFNIGYDYDVYRRCAGVAELSRLVARLDRRGASRAQAQRHVLARHRRRIRGRAEDRIAEPRLSLPQLGDLVLHLRRQLQAEFTRSHAHICSTSSRTRPTSRSGRTSWRTASRPPGSSSMATGGRIPRAGCRTTRGSSGRRTSRPLPGGGKHLVLPARRRHVQGAGRLPRLPDAGATPGADHPRLLASRGPWCSTPFPAAGRQPQWRRSWTDSRWRSISRPSTCDWGWNDWQRSRSATPWSAPEPLMSARALKRVADWTKRVRSRNPARL